MGSSEKQGVEVRLQSDEHEELLNIIDDLRSQGISEFVDLPQLIVCGDQSSGKSSVLEAVSGIRFPTNDDLCTRFATELILRRGPSVPATVTIIPGANRSNAEDKNLEKFNARPASLEDIPGVIESAKEAMGISGATRNFSDDILRIEVSGESQPHLTLVDLPGLFHAGDESQSDEEAGVVASLVLSYMKKQRSIILAVVSAKNDYANQIITKHSRKLDPMGRRTLGIITKPDTLHSNSDSERKFVVLAANKNVKFRLGWHVLKNRDYDTRNSSSEERDRAEKDFFSRGIWTTLPPSCLGIDTLKPRLSSVLREQILSELPDLVQDVQSEVDDCCTRLSRLGDSRGNIREQREYLQKVGTKFSNLIKAAIDGLYGDKFFGSALEEEGYSKRLRAVVQNCCSDFANEIRLYGHHKAIYTEDDVDELPEHDEPGPIPIWRHQYLEDVALLMKRSRGCELPGTFNPLIIGELFFEQSRPWEDHVQSLKHSILEATTTAVHLTLQHVMDANTADKLLRNIINPKLAQIKQKLAIKIEELLDPHQRGHPITYNHYFTDNVLKARQNATREKLSRKLKSFLTPYLQGSSQVYNASFNMQDLLSSLTNETEKDMDRHACSDATDCMLAYYKVAMKVLIDSVASLGLEKMLITTLPDILTAHTVNTLDDNAVQDIAGETRESQAERVRLNDKLDILNKSLDQLQRLDRHKSGGPLDAGPDEPEKDHDAQSSSSDADYPRRRPESPISTLSEAEVMEVPVASPRVVSRRV